MDSSCDWRTTKKGVLAKNQYLLNNGQWSDCKFLVGVSPRQELLKAHKIYLALSSPVFETMFFGSMPEGSEPIKVPDAEPEAFKAMLKFIYTDKLSLSHLELARDIYCCAKKYMLPDLAEKCSIYMKSNLSPGGVCKIYETANLFDDSELSKQCLGFMRTETKKILTAESWSDTLMSTVSVLYEQDTLAIDSENDLYEALLVWCRAECSRKSLPSDQSSLRSVTGDLLSKIRFFTLTPDVFANGPGKAEILDKDEILAVLMNLVSINGTIPAPSGFSDKRNPRSKVGLETQMRSCEELYCHRNFVPRDHIFNEGTTCCSSTFMVDTDIKIHGIIVPTQVSPRSVHSKGVSYVEDLAARLYFAPIVDRLQSSDEYPFVYRGEASYDDTVKIRFNPAITLVHHKYYRIDVQLKTYGIYPKRDFERDSYCNNVHFRFFSRQDMRSYMADNDLIQGIIFSKSSSSSYPLAPRWIRYEK